MSEQPDPRDFDVNAWRHLEDAARQRRANYRGLWPNLASAVVTPAALLLEGHDSVSSVVWAVIVGAIFVVLGVVNRRSIIHDASLASVLPDMYLGLDTAGRRSVRHNVRRATPSDEPERRLLEQMRALWLAYRAPSDLWTLVIGTVVCACLTFIATHLATRILLGTVALACAGAALYVLIQKRQGTRYLEVAPVE